MLSIAAFMTICANSAMAEEQPRKPRTLLELLFKNKKKPPKPEKRKTKRRTASSASQPQREEIPEKLENAKVVLVFGDFNAGSLASGLEEAFQAIAGITIESSIKGSSGLVRQDYYDWPSTLPDLLDKTKPAIAVISIGGNDRQEIDEPSVEYAFRSPEWITRYENRIEAITTAARQRNIPLLWAGLPPFKSNSFSADMVTLNSMFREGAEKGGATYIDLWEGFVDEDGKFTYSGSDIDGQQVRLRTSDGLGFTRAGKRKQAYYVERHIRRIIGNGTISTLAGISPDGLPELQYFSPANNQQLVRTDPIAITDPSLDGGDVLLGGPTPPLGAASPLNRLMKSGYTGPETAGRADHYMPETQTR